MPEWRPNLLHAAALWQRWPQVGPDMLVTQTAKNTWYLSVRPSVSGVMAKTGFMPMSCRLLIYHISQEGIDCLFGT